LTAVAVWKQKPTKEMLRDYRVERGWRKDCCGWKVIPKEYA
jgi:hypothetical protein